MRIWWEVTSEAPVTRPDKSAEDSPMRHPVCVIPYKLNAKYFVKAWLSIFRWLIGKHPSDNLAFR